MKRYIRRPGRLQQSRQAARAAMNRPRLRIEGDDLETPPALAAVSPPTPEEIQDTGAAFSVLRRVRTEAGIRTEFYAGTEDMMRAIALAAHCPSRAIVHNWTRKVYDNGKPVADG
jgi:hypothetical protein